MNSIAKFTNMFTDYTYKEINRFKLNGVLTNENDKIGVHFDKNGLDRKDVIVMVKYCKLYKYQTLMIVTDRNYDWIHDLVTYNGLEYMQMDS